MSRQGSIHTLLPEKTRPADSQPSFREYVHVRKYDYGRGSAAAWTFIAFARGDGSFPHISCWRELQAYLEDACVAREHLTGARSVWRSFKAFRSRHPRQARNETAVPR